MDLSRALDLSVLPGFVAVILLFLAPPGPDMAYVVAVGLDRGRRAAVLAILGIGAGMSVSVVAVVLGVAELARSHPALVTALQVVGAFYLLWLAAQTVRHARRPGLPARSGRSRRAFTRGVTVSLTNPKVLLFFLAVLPQFVGDATNVRAQLAVLGAVDVVIEVLLYGAIGALAGRFAAERTGRGRAGVALSLTAAAVYAGLAVAVLGELVVR